MGKINSDLIAAAGPRANQVRLDAVDVVLLRELIERARTPNKLLASRAGIAPSTSLARVRHLESIGVIRGYHADVDLGAIGLGVTALVSLRIHTPARPRMLEIARSLRQEPHVLNAFLIGGDRDILLHVVCSSTEELRDFVNEKLGTNPDIASSMTNLVFEHL